MSLIHEALKKAEAEKKPPDLIPEAFGGRKGRIRNRALCKAKRLVRIGPGLYTRPGRFIFGWAEK